MFLVAFVLELTHFLLFGAYLVSILIHSVFCATGTFPSVSLRSRVLPWPLTPVPYNHLTTLAHIV